MKIIAFEGIDGSGKGTQFKLLKERLEEEGKRCLTLSFPDYESFFGKEIGNLLAGKDSVNAETVDAKSMALWYALDRFECFKNVSLVGCEGDYDFLLIDRYVLSNIAYQSVRAGANLSSWILDLEHIRLGLPKPDLYLVMLLDHNQVTDNLKQKGFRNYVGEGLDVYEKSRNLLEDAAHVYKRLADELENCEGIVCFEGDKLLSKEKICENVWDAIVNRGLLN